MRQYFTVLGFLGALSLVAAGCSDGNVSRRIPKANPKKVAIGAAAVAGALTLAGAPSRGGPKKEKPGGGDKRPQKSKESVPSSVLDRLDAQDDEDEKQDCEREDAKKQKTVELIPTEGGSTVPPPKKKKCRDDEPEPDDDKDTESK